MSNNKLKSLLKIEEIESYTENGCNMRPRTKNETLYRINYWEESRNFGTEDGLAVAISLAEEKFGSISVRLAIPTLVFAVVKKDG